MRGQCRRATSRSFAPEVLRAYHVGEEQRHQEDRMRPGPGSPLPVTWSILAPTALLEEIAAAYPIGQPSECRWHTSSMNDLYLVRTATDRYMLKVYRAGWRSLADVRYELDLVRHLQRKGVPITAPLVRKDGAVTCSFPAPEGWRPAVLFAHAPGAPPAWPFYTSARDSALFGGALAALHNASDDFVSPHPRFCLDGEYLLEQPLSAIQAFLQHRPDDWRYLQGAVARLQARLSALTTAGLSWGMCHGDFQCGNGFIADDHTVTVFDFDHSAPGWRAYDVARFRRETLASDAAVWTAFLAGYRERRHLGAVDEAAIPLFTVAHEVFRMGLQLAGVVQHWWDSWWLTDAYFDEKFTFLRTWESSQ